MFSSLVTLIYAIACTVFGFGLLRLLGLPHSRLYEIGVIPGTATAFLIGQSVLAACLLLLGFGGFLSVTVIVSLVFFLILAGALSGYKYLAITYKSLLSGIREAFLYDIQSKIFLLMLLVIVVLLGIAAYYKPPVGDAEAFYMVYPKIIAASQKLTVMSGYESFSQIGLLGELHYAALMAIAGQGSAKFFTWFIMLASAFMVVGLLNACKIQRMGKIFGLFILFSSSAFIAHVSDGKVDLFAAALGLGAVFWALYITDSETRVPAIRLTGLLAGFAMVSKFSYIPSLIPALITLIFLRVYSHQQISSSRGFGAVSKESMLIYIPLGIWALIAFTPHLIKNAVLFDSPFVPFIGGASWTNQTWFSPEDTAWIVMTYPLALIFGRYPMQGGNQSFLLLAFLPLIYFLPRTETWRRSIITHLTIAAIVGTVTWVVLKPSIIAPRYILVVLLLFIPLAAKAAEWVYISEVKPRIISTGIVLCILCSLVFNYLPYKRLSVFISEPNKGDTDNCYMASPYCSALKKINRVAEKGARVYFASYYSYWLRPDLLQCRNNTDDLKVIENSDNFMKSLYLRGFTYVALDKAAYPSVRNKFTNSAVPENLSVESIIETQELIVYRINNKTTKQYIKCRQVDYPAWELIKTE